MVALLINGIEIDFPYQPYGAQIRYMSKVIDALRLGKNALLESPTGTGKTLCLLCAALAWRHIYIAALQARTISSTAAQTSLLGNAGVAPSDANTSALDIIARPTTVSHLAAPRLIFSSRTHSQLAQAIKELKKTIYKPSMSILASRDQLCIHEVSSSMSGSRLNSLCKRMTQRRECRYHLPIASNRSYENRSEELVTKMQHIGAVDIEELQEFGRSQGACPWFLSRMAAQADGCEILFVPYNYLLDKGIRSTLEIDWSNDIVIIDEAHNLEAVCADSMSFDLTASMRAQCDAQLCKTLDNVIHPGGLVIPAMKELEKTKEGIDSLIGSENRGLKEIRILRDMLQTLGHFSDNASLDRGGKGSVRFCVHPGGRLRQLLAQNQGPSADDYELFLNLIDRAIGTDAEISTGEKGNVLQQTQSSDFGALKFIQSAIRILFESSIAGNESCYRTVIQESRTNTDAGRTISYWCFKPAIGMKNLASINLRCLLLTSGTLSPMSAFAAELGLEFPIRLENPHVVSRPQIWAGIIKAGPEVNGVRGTRLTSAYHARGEQTSIELGRTLIRIASVVPDGLLVFFPSYASLYYCVEIWQKYGPFPNRANPSIWEHVLQKKPVVVEERESSKFAAAILAHRSNVDMGGGSILLAVCRGKVSEGIDFSDEYGRAVMITGLPFPSAMDPQVILKREFADEEVKCAPKQSRKLNSRTGTTEIINGSEWYAIQAIRAVNQAVGRAIRHRLDFGAIILCDERFQSKDLQKKISKWIRPSLTLYPTYLAGETSLQTFFSRAAVSDFAKQGKLQRIQAQKFQIEHGGKTHVGEAQKEGLNTAKAAISKMNPPGTTDQEFMTELINFSAHLEEDKSLKRDVPGQNRPTNCEIDALDFGCSAARGGLLDSGTLRSSSAKESPVDGHHSGKRSAKFLAARSNLTGNDDKEELESKRARHAQQANVKRIRLLGKTQTLVQSSRATPIQNSAEKVKLSDRIKALFSNREEQREFLRIFREVLTLDGKIREGVGPLQTHELMSQREKKGKHAVKDLVELAIRREANTNVTKEFLQDLRAKVPALFRSCYDMTVNEELRAPLVKPKR